MFGLSLLRSSWLEMRDSNPTDITIVIDDSFHLSITLTPVIIIFC